jgi:hypothetical protein
MPIAARTFTVLTRLLRWIRRFLIIALIVVGLVVNLYLVDHFICGDCFPILAQLNHVSHFVLLSSVIALGLALALRARWRQVAWFMPSVVIFGLWFGGNWLPKSTPEVEGIEIKVATYNIQGNVSDPDASRGPGGE